MHSWLVISNYISIKQLISNYLTHALSSYTQNAELPTIELEKIPLYQGRDNSKILYISGVAQQLSKSHNCKAMEVAEIIKAKLSATSGGVFVVKIVPPGWIHLELSHLYLANWLQNLEISCTDEQTKIETREIISPSQNHNPSSMFTVQYAHARCCSLVLQAQREGLIKLKEPLPATNRACGQLISKELIPWLNDDSQLYLCHPTEGALITQLVQVVDEIVCLDVSSAVNWQKVSLDLSQALEKFWCQCRIWGEVKIYSLELAQARLGLMMTTQRLLRFLLIEKLGVFAPVEL